MTERAMPFDADQREALYNDRRTGPAYEIQLPLERITRLLGILFDLDPKHLIPGNSLFPPADNPRDFYAGIRAVLERHPLARFGEVRASGTGLHLLLWLSPCVELHNEGEQKYWDAIVKTIQRTLPIDINMPGITALTRPLGSVNSKNGAVVECLKTGQSITLQQVNDYIANLSTSPFKEVAFPLLGSDRISPCPVCRGEGTRLDVLDRVGKCYNGCSKVSLADLFDRIYRPLKSEEVQPVAASATTGPSQLGEPVEAQSSVLQGVICGSVGMS